MGKSAKRRQQEKREAANAAIRALQKMTGDEAKIPVKVFADHALYYEELWLEIHVEGTDADKRAFAELFARAKCRKASDPEHADIVIFTGGADVNPKLYGEIPHAMTRWDDTRDSSDKALYDLCFNKGIPMVGVCRGAQFGWVMAGGKLIQHLDNHVGDHPIWVPADKDYIQKTSSVHHQAIKWDARIGGAKLLATARESTLRYLSPSIFEENKKMDVEAFYLEDTCFLGVQGHPEYKDYNRYAVWFIKAIRDYLVYNPYVKVEEGYLRLKKDDLAFAKQTREETTPSSTTNDNDPQENK